jgi:hypothetical protein
MAVLISTKAGFINAVVEPQFQVHGTGLMVTVQFSSYDDVRELKRQLKGDVLFDQNANMFPFTSFIHLEDLMQSFKRRKLWGELQNTKVDFSKTPVAYYWEAYYTGESADEGEEIDTSLYFGNELPEDIEHVRWGFDRYPDVFHVYPLYEMPGDLIKSGESLFEVQSDA